MLAERLEALLERAPGALERATLFGQGVPLRLRGRHVTGREGRFARREPRHAERQLRVLRAELGLPLPQRSLAPAELGLAHHTIAWQSAGRTADPWWGPPLEDVIDGLAAEGFEAVVVCSAGFVADHLEILYDLDIEARERAEGLLEAFTQAHGVHYELYYRVLCGGKRTDCHPLHICANCLNCEVHCICQPAQTITSTAGPDEWLEPPPPAPSDEEAKG